MDEEPGFFSLSLTLEEGKVLKIKYWIADEKIISSLISSSSTSCAMNGYMKEK